MKSTKKHILATLLKLIFPAVLFLILYRLQQKLTQPENLFSLGWSLFLLLFVSWTTSIGRSMLARSAKDDLGSNKPEAWYLSGASLLIIAAFLLSAQGLDLANKSLVQTIPWLTEAGYSLQAFIGGFIYIVVIWLVHFYLNKALPKRDPYLFPLTSILCGTGLVLLFRLGPDLGELRQKSGFVFLYWLQLRSLLVSLLVFLLAVKYCTVQRLDSLTRKRYVYVLLSVLLITLTALFGQEMHGRKLAINLGVMNFQTVELVKLLALLFMVGYFRYEERFMAAGTRFGLPRTRYLLPYLTMWFLTLLPIFLQRDLGPTVLIFSLFLVVFYLGTGSGSSVLIGFATIVCSGVAAYYSGVPSMVRTRVDMWLDPFIFSQNLSEALWAISSGGWFGTGPGLGLCHYIPVVQSDFNFIALAEEWGLVGITTFMAVIGLLVRQVIHLALQAKASYLQLFFAGVGALWMLQSFIIIGGNLGLLPLTGITLPFVSYGGSSLMINFLLLAMVIRYSDWLRAGE